jgi:hypothetical protein
VLDDEKITLEHALEEINLGEIRIAEKYFGKVFGEEGIAGMSPMESLAAGIWSRERRLRPTGGFQLADTEKFSLKQANEYFADEVEIDAETPETEQGKDGLPAAETPESELSSAPS